MRKLGRKARSIAVAATASLATIMASGCYEKVIDARGPGAGQYRIEEPDRKRDFIDDWFGEPVQRDGRETR